MGLSEEGSGMERPEERRISKSAEDYLEAIYVLSSEKGYARVLEIARYLGVKPPSVTQMLKKLRSMGLVHYERYGRVVLTEPGLELARKVASRHADLKAFLVALGLAEPVAEEEACAMEHILHEETIAILRRIGEFLSNAPRGLRCLKCLRTGRYLCLSQGAPEA